MKFYHLIGTSALLLTIEFILRILLKLHLAIFIRWIFVFLQGGLLFFYSIALFLYIIGSSRKKWIKKQQSLQPKK